MSKKNELYKNAPLIETVFEVRFPGEPAVECNRDKFYEKIRDVYSEVLVPGFPPVKAVALEPYSFRNKNGNAVMLSIDKLSVSCRKYEGFKVFKKEVMRIFSIFGKMFKIEKIKRTGLRYINVIPFARTGNIIPLQDFLNINVQLPESISTDFKNLNIVFVSQAKGGTVTTRIEPVISQDQTREVLILDFDYAKDGDLSFRKISDYIVESHQHTKHMFEQLIAENYKKVMRDEVI